MEVPEIPQIGQSLKKSQTHSFALPSINRTRSKIPKYKTSRVSQHRSVFMDKVKDLTTDTRYEEMDASHITEQQKKLKNILRQFNQETYHILGRYIDKPINQSSKKSRSTSVAITSQIRDKQIDNNQQILQICKRQLNNLQKRSQNLKFLSLEDYERKITQIEKDIEQIKVDNKGIAKGNKLRGLGLKKDDEKDYNEVSDLQQQKYILQLKKQRLVSDTEYVTAQQKSLNHKNTEADKKIQQLSQQYNKIIKQETDQSSQINIKSRLSDKRKLLQKKKLQKQGGSLSGVAKQHRQQGHYLKQLQMLDQQKSKIQQIQQNTHKVAEKIQTSKRQVLINEHRLSLLKKGMINDRNLDKIIEEDKKKEGCTTS